MRCLAIHIQHLNFDNNLSNFHRIGMFIHTVDNF